MMRIALSDPEMLRDWKRGREDYSSCVSITREHPDALINYDSNPFHRDDNYAVNFGRSVGLNGLRGRVFHGMGTLAIGLTHLLRDSSFRFNRAGELSEIEVMFSSPIQPGDNVKYAMFYDKKSAVIEARNGRPKPAMTATLDFGGKYIAPPTPSRIADWMLASMHELVLPLHKSVPEKFEFHSQSRELKKLNCSDKIRRDLEVGLDALGAMPAISGILGEAFPGERTLWGSHSGTYYFGGDKNPREVHVDLNVAEEPEIKMEKPLTKVVVNSGIRRGLGGPLIFEGREVIFVPNPYFEKGRLN